MVLGGMRFSLFSASLFCFFSAFSSSQAAEIPPEFKSQLAAELTVAPAESRLMYKASPQKFKEFVEGRLIDEHIAQYARGARLDEAAPVRAVIGAFVRDTLVRASMADLIERERKTLPDLEGLAKQYYLAHQSEFTNPESAKVAHILIRVDLETMTDQQISAAREKAEATLKRLVAGEDFVVLAAEVSDEKATSGRGGELPRRITRDSVVPPFAAATWALKPGEISGVVRTRFGYHIVKLLDMAPASVEPFDQVKGKILGKLEGELIAPKRVRFAESFRYDGIERDVEKLSAELMEGLDGPGQKEPVSRKAKD